MVDGPTPSPFPRSLVPDGVRSMGIYIIDDDGLRIFAGPFESESTAIAWIIQRQETMNLCRSERASAIH
jgi:hypothetical protein